METIYETRTIESIEAELGSDETELSCIYNKALELLSPDDIYTEKLASRLHLVSFRSNWIWSVWNSETILKLKAKLAEHGEELLQFQVVDSSVILKLRSSMNGRTRTTLMNLFIRMGLTLIEILPLARTKKLIN